MPREGGAQIMNARRHLRLPPLSAQGRFVGRVRLERATPQIAIPPKAAPPAPRSNGKGCRVIGTARAKDENFAITVNHRAIGVAPVDLERGVLATARTSPIG